MVVEHNAFLRIGRIVIGKQQRSKWLVRDSKERIPWQLTFQYPLKLFS
jgi:hypothetical protein